MVCNSQRMCSPSQGTRTSANLHMSSKVFQSRLPLGVTRGSTSQLACIVFLEALVQTLEATYTRVSIRVHVHACKDLNAATCSIATHCALGNDANDATAPSEQMCSKNIYVDNICTNCHRCTIERHQKREFENFLRVFSNYISWFSISEAYPLSGKSILPFGTLISSYTGIKLASPAGFPHARKPFRPLTVSCTTHPIAFSIDHRVKYNVHVHVNKKQNTDTAEDWLSDKWHASH